jgi:ankyrin repeat protein
VPDPLFSTAALGKLDVARVLVGELGADVNQASDEEGNTPLIFAHRGDLPMVKCLVKEFGADVNKATEDGSTERGQLKFILLVHFRPYVTNMKHHHVAVWLIKNGVKAQALAEYGATAADISKKFGAPAEQTAYLEARTYCANPGCDGAGLKKNGIAWRRGSAARSARWRTGRRTRRSARRRLPERRPQEE